MLGVWVCNHAGEADGWNAGGFGKGIVDVVVVAKLKGFEVEEWGSFDTSIMTSASVGISGLLWSYNWYGRDMRELIGCGQLKEQW